MSLGRRIGYDLAARLMARLRVEQRQQEFGVREPDQPSEALTLIEQALLGSEFTPEERRTIRFLNGLDPMRDVGLVPDQSSLVSRVQAGGHA